MPTLDLTLEGLSNMKAKLAAVEPTLRQAIKRELYQFAEDVMRDSKAVVPVDTGALMNTGKVKLPEDDGKTIVVQLGYGDESADYAVYVHEALEGSYNPNWSWAKAAAAGHQINWSRPGSGPKYLEHPLHQKQDSLPGRLAEAIEEALKP